MTKQLKCYYLLLIRYYKLSLLNQFLEGYSIMAAWGNNFFKKNFFLLFFHFSAPLKCHWPIWASSLKSHSPAGRIYSPLATGRVLMKRLWPGSSHAHNPSSYQGYQISQNPEVSKITLKMLANFSTMPKYLTHCIVISVSFGKSWLIFDVSPVDL